MKQHQFQTHYRPEWTCGRFDTEKSVALMYNLIEGQSYFFEGYSASVVGEILSVDRGQAIDLNSISSSTGIHIDSITEFIGTLLDVGLVVQDHSKDKIQEIRKQTVSTKLGDNEHPDSTLPYDISSAEQAYSDAISSPLTVSTVMFELTYNCSEKCIHCYNAGASRNDGEANHRNRAEMGLGDYRRVIDELYDWGLYKVCLTGGDPFSKPIAWEIIDYLYERGIAFDIFTNGQSIVNHAERLADYYPRLIGLSVYSAIEDVHDSITRVKGSLRKTLSLAKRLGQYGVPMSFKCVVFKTNVKSYYTVADLAEQYRAVPQFEVNLTNAVDGDVSVVNNLRLPADVLEIVLRDGRTPMYVGRERDNYGGVPKPLDAMPCRAGVGTFNITPEGELTPCCAFPTSFGNVCKTSIRDIITSSNSFHQWQSVKVEDIESCGKDAKCAFCMLCVGNGYIEHGTPLKPSSTNCFLAETRYNLAQKLQNGNDPLNGLSISERLSQVVLDPVASFGREFTINHRNKELTLK